MLAYTLAGLLVGFLVGLTGVGGGSLMTPLLIFVFGIPPVVAVGTDLLFAAITKLNGAVAHGLRHTVEWRVVALLGAGSVPASLATAAALDRWQQAGAQLDALVTLSLGGALILTSLALVFKRRLHRMGRELVGRLHGDWTHWRPALTVATGLVLGALVTLSSVGAGALGAAILFFLYPRLPAVRVVGTDIAHAVPLTAIAGLGHLHLGSVDPGLLGSLLLGSLPGIYLGSHLGANIPERVMRPLLASMLMAIGVKFIW